MRHIQRRMWVAVPTVMAAALISACSTPASPPADSHSARVAVDGREIPTTYSVLCTQRDWLWTIETLEKGPGFTAIVQTGATVSPKVVRLRNLQGFTGSSADEAADTQVRIDGTTFHISGTAHGSFADRPTKPAQVQYRVEARC